MSIWIAPTSGQCADCQCFNGSPCIAPDAIFKTWRSRSASKTKCGFAEYASPSSPPKIYLQKSFSGTLTTYQFSIFDSSCTTCLGAIQDTFSGTCTFNRLACTSNAGANKAQSTSSDCSTFGSATNTGVCNTTLPANYPETKTQTTRTLNGASCFLTGVGYFSGSGSIVETISSEYTTATLASDVDTLLGAASWGSYTTPNIDAVFTQSSDQLTISKREVQVKMTFCAVKASTKLTYDIYNRTSGTLVSNNCVNLSTGATEYVADVPPPASPGDAYYVTNELLAVGPC